MERLTDDRFLKDGFYQPKSKDEEKEIRSMGKDLTFEKLYRHCAEVEKQNAELQKQVDVLTKRIAISENDIGKLESEIDDLKYEQKQAVKDTAKEILQDLIDKAYVNECIDLTVAEVKAWFREDYGVEVE